MVEVNEVLYPLQYDSELNFPSVTEVTEATGSDINRNRDAIVRIEHVLGIDPHIGLYTEDPLSATVNKRIEIIENGLAEGRFAFNNINVNNSLLVTTDITGSVIVDIGGDEPGTRIAPVNVRGPMHIFDSGIASNQAIIDVPVHVNARANAISGGSVPGEPILTITDSNANPLLEDRLALIVDGNVLIQNGRLFADFAVSHTQLSDIDTIPRSSVSAFHVSRGDYHSHKRKTDPATGALLDEVDSSPVEETNGLINHEDLLSIHTKTGQTSFIPVTGIAYHVTNGDDHDHKDGRGAQLNHDFMANTDPQTSNHVTNGNSHAHSSAGDGGVVSHYDLTNIGFLNHTEIDYILNVDYKEHINLIDPINADDIDTAFAGEGHHVPQGHVSDNNAHHARYTDEEALAVELVIAADTTSYELGQNTTLQGHIQALGNGTVSEVNSHGLSAGDIGALGGYDAQGNLPDLTQQLLETTITSILQDPEFGALSGNVDEVITGLWTFQHLNGIVIQEGSGGATQSFDYSIASRVPDAINHIDNTGTSPYHAAADLSYDPSGSATPLTATNVKAALDEISEGRILPFTFTTNLPAVSPTGTSRFGFKLPVDINAEVYDASVMWHGNVGGAVSVTVDVLHGPSAGAPVSIMGGAFNIHGAIGPDAPTWLTSVVPFVPTIASGVAPGDNLFVDIGHTGAGNYDVTVTVYIRLTA